MYMLNDITVCKNVIYTWLKIASKNKGGKQTYANAYKQGPWLFYDTIEDE